MVFGVIGVGDLSCFGDMETERDRGEVGERRLGVGSGSDLYGLYGCIVEIVSGSSLGVSKSSSSVYESVE